MSDMPILDMPVLDMPETSLQSPQSAYIETIDDRLSKDLALSDSEDDETEENTQILTFTPKYFSTPKNMSEDNIHKSKTEENIHMSKTEENINIETTIEKMKAGFRFMGTATAVHKSKTEDNIHKSKTEKNIHTEDNINIKTTIEKMKEQSLSPNLRGLRGFHVPNKPSASRIPPPPSRFVCKDEKLQDTPSVRAGYSIEKEQRYRREMCSFIQVCLCSFS